MKLQRAKGTRDLGPEDAIILEDVVRVLKKNFALFGFNPIQTPILERFDVLSSKYAGGAEILKETFQLEDQGKRKLALRYDLTVPFSRFVAMNPHLKMPFKRYQVGRVFRDGPIKASRYREFGQCDCDVVGTRSMAADAECIELFLQSFKELGLPVVVRVNNRKILDAIMETLGIVAGKRGGVILALDKMVKKSQKDVEEEIFALGVEKKSIKKLLAVFAASGNTKENIEAIAAVIGKDAEGLQELQEVLRLCPTKGVQFVPSLARGLSYYTGTIFEVYVKDGSISSSIGSGGRYDKMVGALMGSKAEVPAVGCSFGLDVVVDALKLKRKRVQKSVVQVYVIPVGVPVKNAWAVVKELRASGVAADLDFKGKGASKAFRYADAYGISYVCLIGENEVKKKKVMLKNLGTGEQKLVTVAQVVKKVVG